ncbi:MAG: ketopantoate reductase family protein [Deltaproteobacteria bacterium]|nr:ketopantoate reductase family protein [Deltaproteobacteria bacterium]
MQILVLGAGAIGSVFAGLLCRAGHRVTIVARPAHVDAIKRQGLVIDGIWGTHRVAGLRCVARLAELSQTETGAYDYVLLCVKSHATEGLVKELLQYCPDPPPVVSLQNGLGNLEVIEKHIGRDRVIGGRVIFGVEFIEPARVTVTVCADKTIIGGLRSGIASESVRKLARAFTEAGLEAEATNDIHRFIWGKVLYNCCLNGLATLLRVTYGKLLLSSGTREIMRLIIEEFFLVCQACRIELDWQSVDEYRQVLFDKLIPMTSEHHPSMLQDIMKGKQTEIDSLNGALVDIAAEHGLYLPLNQTITHLIKAKEGQI